jgi:hypothetical protein
VERRGTGAVMELRNRRMGEAFTNTWGHGEVWPGLSPRVMSGSRVLIVAGVCADVCGPCCHQRPSDVGGLGCCLRACWCLGAILTLGPNWFECPVLSFEAMVMSWPSTVLEGHVWVHGPADARVSDNGHGLNNHQRPRGYQWSGLPPKTMWMSEGHAATGEHTDLSGLLHAAARGHVCAHGLIPARVKAIQMSLVWAATWVWVLCWADLYWLPHLGELVLLLAWAAWESWPSEYRCRRADSWPTQLPPRSRSRALSWPIPTSTPPMNCWSLWKSHPYRGKLQDHRATAGYPRGVLVRIQYWWYSRRQRPQTKSTTHCNEYLQVKKCGQKGRYCVIRGNAVQLPQWDVF